jgi:phosphoribosylaminoimidazolecarboxamide formyltransferase/IMP cyclohydrolase
VPLVRRALISVSDKRGLAEFARALRSMNVEIISTGGTYTMLSEARIDARLVSDVTGFPEILDGRVKTLHPRIHAGLLAVTDNPDHERQLAEHQIEPIDMVVVNLYPFEETITQNSVTLADAIEQIDIGGPAMIRSAAKNYRHKVVVVNPDRYDAIIGELRERNGQVGEETCFRLAQEVFQHTSAYDAAIAQYLSSTEKEHDILPDTLTVTLHKEADLRYGENPHQRGALYGTFSRKFRKLHGKELSYNNIVDIAAAAELVSEFDDPTVAIIKHTNPCGVGSAETLLEAYEKALATDTASAYGGIIAVNRPLDSAVVERINEIFTEVIVAPAYPEDVFRQLTKKKDRRLMVAAPEVQHREMSVRSVPGGLLLQTPDAARDPSKRFSVVTRRQPTDTEHRAMLFAWRVAKHVKSNAIVYTREDRTVGIGAGQMSRVDSARIARVKAGNAGLDTRGTAVASDAFFPFADGLLEAVEAGSTAVIQPGGSIRDVEVIRAADDHDLCMIFTGIRHFKH